MIAVAAAGAWAIDHDTAHAIGAWRDIPVALLIFYAALVTAIQVVIVACSAQLRLTDTHLILRTAVRRRRWAWAELRDVRVLEIAGAAGTRDGPSTPQDAALISILTLVTVRGEAVALPGPFRSSGFRSLPPQDPETERDPDGEDETSARVPAELIGLADRLGAGVREHHPAAVALDEQECARAVQQVQADLEAARRNARRRGKLWSVAFAVLGAAALSVLGERIVGGSAHQRLYAVVNLGVILVIGVQGLTARRSKVWRRIGFALQILTAGWVIAMLFVQAR
jgi:hypothetical protein